MWCAREGSLECGVILSQWCTDTLQKRDSEGLNPAQIAVARGHVKLASELEKIQNNRTLDFVPGLSLGFSMNDMSLSMSPSPIPGEGSIIQSARQRDNHSHHFNFTQNSRISHYLLQHSSRPFLARASFFFGWDKCCLLEHYELEFERKSDWKKIK